MLAKTPTKQNRGFLELRLKKLKKTINNETLLINLKYLINLNYF